MFDIGWTEMLVVACVAIIVVGPKDLPKVLRGFGRAMKSIRGLAGDFQKQFEEAVKDADLDEVKNIASGKGFAPLDDVKKSVTEFEKDVKAQMEARTKEADAAVEAEAAGLPEPVSTKPVAESAETGTAKAKTANSTKAPAKKAPAKKPGSRKVAATKSATAAKSTSGKSAKTPANKPSRKPAQKTEKTA